MPSLTFASWAQSPIGQAIEMADHAGTLGAATFQPGLSLLRPDGTQEPITALPLSMLGPEGVASLDPRCVVRMEPADSAGEVEDNYLAAVELVPPELPWLLTPARPGEHGRLRPWIVLVVVEVTGRELHPGRPLPTLAAGTDQLPDLADAWGWAHVQQAAEGLGALAGQPVARLLCPRRLAASTRYRACVVPAFAGGVAAGLGLPADTVPDPHAPAWDVAQSTRVTLPVFHSWEFGTGVQGDFEQLVRRLGPAPDERVGGLGRRLVDVERPWPEDDPLNGAPPGATLLVAGALTSLDPGAPGTVPDGALTDMRKRLLAELDTPADRVAKTMAPETQARALAPPIYGGAHVSRDRVTAPSQGGTPWVDELNLAIPERIAAGLGTEYIRANQESLMARAWEQVGAIREANRRRALAQLATSVAESVHARHIETMSAGEAVALSAPAAWRTELNTEAPSLAAEVAVSTLTTAAASTAFARFMRPAGPVARATGTAASRVIERGLTAEVEVPLQTPLLKRLETVGAAATGPLGLVADAAIQAERGVAAAGSVVTMQALASVARINGLTEEAAGLDAALEGLPVDRMAVRAGDLRLVRASLITSLDTVAAAVGNVEQTLQAAPAAGGTAALTPYGIRADLATLQGRVHAALAPGDRIARRLASQITMPAAMGAPRSLAPIMAHPVFPEPAALGLLQTAPEWFLPGIGQFPAESVTLLEVNARFVEAYLVGLAHEFNRELLWREFPTDRRGTPFRAFWPRPGAAPDIPEIGEWAGALGEHMASGTSHLAVLLVRGTVVRRFPDMTVVATPAVSAGANMAPGFDPDPTHWLSPLFATAIDAQTLAYGFAIDPETLRPPPTEATPGWFFAFQEHSFRVRFGFDLVESDPPAADRPFDTWNDLDWPRVPVERGFAVAARELAVPANETGEGAARWNADAADVARICVQRPFRVLIHAHELVGR